MKNTIAALFITSLILSNSADAALLKILSTEPDTQVYEVTDPMNKKSLGRAPLTLEQFDTSEPRVLLLEKPGFSSAYIPFSQSVATHFSVMATMHPLINWTSEELNRKTVEMAESIVDRITAIQSLIDARKIKEAITQIETLKNEYPNSFSVRLIHANALLLNGEGQKARAIYSALLNEVPSNRTYMKDALEMMQSRINKRMPASVGGNQ
jgi:predicted Zn-dependent protease